MRSEFIGLSTTGNSRLERFNIWYVLMGLFGAVYRTMAWQNQGAYTTAAVTPHEFRMGGVMAHQIFADQAHGIRQQLSQKVAEEAVPDPRHSRVWRYA